MFWVLLIAGIAVVGLVVLVCYGVWLAHKAADVMSEVRVLTDRAGQLGDLLAQVQFPAASALEEAREEPATIATSPGSGSGAT